jgi:hypothetical protein
MQTFPPTPLPHPNQRNFYYYTELKFGPFNHQAAAFKPRNKKNYHFYGHLIVSSTPFPHIVRQLTQP